MRNCLYITTMIICLYKRMKTIEKEEKTILSNFAFSFFVSRNIFIEFIQCSNFPIDGFGYFCWIALEKKFTKSVYYDIGFILNITSLEKTTSSLERFYRKKILLRLEKQLKFFPASVLSNKVPQSKELLKLVKKLYLEKKTFNSFLFEKKKFTEFKNITFNFIRLDKIYYKSLLSQFKIKTNLLGPFVFY